MANPVRTAQELAEIAVSLVGWVTCDPRVTMMKFATTAWVQEPTLPDFFRL